MYASFFGLHDEPFSVAPDPRFMYLSDAHREALKHLELGLRGGGGFVLLTGEIGAGKTTVWRAFLETLPADVDIATVVNPRLRVDALLARVCEDLRVELPDGPARDPIDALHGHLLLTHAQGRRTLIAVDEAQALSDDVLEQLRLLTNLVTSDRKLVQVLLIGQPELLDTLARPEMEPLAQRVVSRYHLPALPADETRRYIAHRLAVAGAGGPLPFDDAALARIHAFCHGIPRRINVLCDRTMLAAFEARRPRIGRDLVDQVADQVFTRPARPSPPEMPAPAPAVPAEAAPPPAAGQRIWPWIALALLVGGIASPWVRGLLAGPEPTPAVAAAAAASPAPAVAPPSTATAPGAAEPSLPRVTLSDLYAGAVDEGDAWRTLALAWKVTLGPGDPCAAAAAQGLQCHRGKGGLAPIRVLDRPVVLPLVDGAGRRCHPVLVGLDGGLATLRLGERLVQLPMVELARDWRGEFATLWRAPAGYRDGQVVSEVDGTVGRWLAERLDRVDGGRSGSLDARVAAFQAAQGLAPDGLAGAMTLMQLNRTAGVDEPRLGADGAGAGR
jgi:general secretion pathway protein A